MHSLPHDVAAELEIMRAADRLSYAVARHQNELDARPFTTLDDLVGIIAECAPAAHGSEVVAATRLHESKSWVTQAYTSLVRLTEQGHRVRVIADGARAASYGLMGQEDRSNRPGFLATYVPRAVAVIDRRHAVVGRDLPGRARRHITVTTNPSIVEAARHYAGTLLTHAQPLDAPPVDDLTPRQRQVAALLAVEVPVEDIARRIGISVRRIYSDIRQIKDVLGTTERYATGYAYARATSGAATGTDG